MTFRHGASAAVTASLVLPLGAALRSNTVELRLLMLIPFAICSAALVGLTWGLTRSWRTGPWKAFWRAVGAALLVTPTILLEPEGRSWTVPFYPLVAMWTEPSDVNALTAILSTIAGTLILMPIFWALDHYREEAEARAATKQRARADAPLEFSRAG